jgi:2,4-dihydroxyhept-2-ene-1,7-dioic acid aldolase
MALKLMYITNSPFVAAIAQKNGVERVWVDLEILGKKVRQLNLNAVLSCHSISDIEKVKPVLTTSKLLVRVNPINSGSEEEINAVIEAGADIVMLPYWKTPEEVKRFLNAVDGRAKTNLLLETKEAVLCLDEVLALSGIDEVHIGINDLHLSYGKNFMFEMLSDGTVEAICKKLKGAGLPYGFGGIARIGEGTLPAEKIVLEHYRIGSGMVILSRSFCNTDLISDPSEIERIFSEGIYDLREFESNAALYTPAMLESNRREVCRLTDEIAEGIKRKRAAV